MEPGIYIIGTPIGNLEDVSLRALRVLGAVDFILAEDTRRTQTLLTRYEIRASLISCHKFNEAARIGLALERVKAGAAGALVTNAGMPGVSDPGARLVQACRSQGIRVTAIPGPSSVTMAIALCGFPAGGFHCEGFLPRKPSLRRRRLGELAAEDCPVVLFESPFRCLRLMGEVREVFGERDLFLGRELTKQHEECLWGKTADLQAEIERRARQGRTRSLRGEFVLVVAPDPSRPPKRESPDTEAADEAGADAPNSSDPRANKGAQNAYRKSSPNGVNRQTGQNLVPTA